MSENVVGTILKNVISGNIPQNRPKTGNMEKLRFLLFSQNNLQCKY